MTACGTATSVSPAGVIVVRGSGDKWRFKGNARMRVVSKLNMSQVRWTVREKAKGEKASTEISEAMHMAVCTV